MEQMYSSAFTLWATKIHEPNNFVEMFENPKDLKFILGDLKMWLYLTSFTVTSDCLCPSCSKVIIIPIDPVCFYDPNSNSSLNHRLKASAD